MLRLRPTAISLTVTDLCELELRDRYTKHLKNHEIRISRVEYMKDGDGLSYRPCQASHEYDEGSCLTPEAPTEAAVCSIQRGAVLSPELPPGFAESGSVTISAAGAIGVENSNRTVTAYEPPDTSMTSSTAALVEPCQYLQLEGVGGAFRAAEPHSSETESLYSQRRERRGISDAIQIVRPTQQVLESRTLHPRSTHSRLMRVGARK